MNPTIEKLIKQFAKLPRVGGRAAQRIVLGLLQDKTGRAAALGAALIDAAGQIAPCAVCGTLTDNREHAAPICEFCRDHSRANGQLCIVRDLADVWTLEKSGIFRGRYHIIGGLLSGQAGITPADLNIATLPARIVNEEITEIIFALPNTIEGKTTQHYIMNTLKIEGQKDKRTKGQTKEEQMSICPFDLLSFTELASGVPLGGDLDYIDDGTLNIAFGGRKKI
ncbi:MAG: recombination protein RecR [Rickettsiales bacterium]|jgi:recombination protein RecR|nr:recombination protein RecR [Rickettsiales bacterium]